MRTSPLGMRRRLRRAPLLLPILVLVVALGAACSDDDGDADTSPTTTSPTSETTEGSDETADDDATTPPPDEETTVPDDEPDETGTVPGDEAHVLDAEQAQAQLEALVDRYRQGVADAAASQALDERALAAFTRAFTGSRARTELEALQQAGVEILNPTPPEVTVSDVEVTSTATGCAAGTATIEGISGFVTSPVGTVQPYYFRLVPAPEGSAAPAWRLSFLNFSTNGQPLEEATCA